MKNTKFTFTKYSFFEEIKIPQTSQKNDVFLARFCNENEANSKACLFEIAT